jgi:uncharacterized protein (TIGR00255 family)
MEEIRSMTGFGHGTADGGGLAVQCDVRSVNHRYCDVHVKLPRDLHNREPKLVQAVRAAVARGRVDVTVRLEPIPGQRARTLRVDTALAHEIRDAFDKLAVALERPEDRPTVAQVAAVDGVLVMEDTGGSDEVREALDGALHDALEGLTRMRRDEGTALARDLAQRLNHIEEWLAQVQQHAEALLPMLRDRLEERLQKLLGETPIDPERVFSEAAIVAEKSDVTEEIVRLGQHVEAFRAQLKGGGRVGRKLDFLAQELHREANTIGSKTPDAEVSHLVIDIKGEIERIREQVQNIE